MPATQARELHQRVAPLIVAVAQVVDAVEDVSTRAGRVRLSEAEGRPVGLRPPTRAASPHSERC